MRYIVTQLYASKDMQRIAEWTAEMLTASQETAKRIGCSPEAIVAQAALETGWGKSAIGNNVFGHKTGPNWKGKRQLVWTREVFDGKSVMIQDWFRDYDTLADGIAGHFELLMGNPDYAAAGVFDPDNTRSDAEYFAAMKAAGYATDPNYVASLLGMLDSVERVKARLSLVDGTEPRTRRLLFSGLQGADVRELRHRLGLAPSDEFNLDTDVAVRAFQRSHGLDDDGIVGPKTYAALGLH